MKKIYLALILVGMIGLVTAFTLTATWDTKETLIKTEGICEAEITMLSIVKKCDSKTPPEVEVNFSKDSKDGVIEVDFSGIERSVVKEEPIKDEK